MTPKRFEKIKSVLNKRQPDLTVIMDNVHKPHNLAAIIRSCDSIGIGSIYGVSKNNQKIGVNLKSASGSNHWVHLKIYNSISSIISELKDKNFSIYAANNSDTAIDYNKVDFKKPTAIILGAELDGLSKKSLKLVDQEINIPMQGMVESLNVSVANAVILFEAQKQRLKAGLYKKRRINDDTYEKLLFEFCYPDVAQTLKNQGKTYPKLDDKGYIIND